MTYNEMKEWDNKIRAIETQEDFNNFIDYLETRDLDNDTDYELYNAAYEKFYGHPAFDKNGNCIE